MTKFIIAGLLFISSSALSQHSFKVFTDSIRTGGLNAVDSARSALLDTSHVFEYFGTEPDYQVWFTVISGRTDTLIVQQKRKWGLGTSTDSGWVQVRVYNPHKGESTDTLFIVDKFVNGSGNVVGEALLWSPFQWGEFRVIRRIPTTTTPHKVFLRIHTRKWNR